MTNKAVKYLSNIDPIFREIASQIGPISTRKRKLSFSAVVKIIISQQLSGKAAETIFSRLQKTTEISPLNLSKLDLELWKEIGVSKNKSNYICDFSLTMLDQPDLLEIWQSLDDKEASLEIQKIKGLGQWSAQIILLFYMNRPDVFPVGDGTLQRAYAELYKTDLNPRKLETYEHCNWAKPHRSTLALYLWAYVDQNFLKSE